MQRPDDPLLNRVHVLALVDDDVAEHLGEPPPQVVVVGEALDGGFENRRVVEVASLPEQIPVSVEGSGLASGELSQQRGAVVAVDDPVADRGEASGIVDPGQDLGQPLRCRRVELA